MNDTNNYYSAFPVNQGWGLGSKVDPETAKYAIDSGLGYEIFQLPGEATDLNEMKVI